MAKQQDERVVILERDLQLLRDNLHQNQVHLKRVQGAAVKLGRAIQYLARASSQQEKVKL